MSKDKKKPKSKPPDQCRKCKHHWPFGKKDGIHNNWCCSYGTTAPKAVLHCKNMGEETYG